MMTMQQMSGPPMPKDPTDNKEVTEVQYVEKVINVPEIQVVEKVVPVVQVVKKEKLVEIVKPEVVERVFNVPKVKYVEKVVEVPETQYRQVEVEKIVEYPEYENKIVVKEIEVPEEVSVYLPQPRQLPVEQEVARNVPVPLDSRVYQKYRMPKIKPVYTEIRVPIYCPRYIEVPIPAQLVPTPAGSRAKPEVLPFVPTMQSPLCGQNMTPEKFEKRNIDANDGTGKYSSGSGNFMSTDIPDSELVTCDDALKSLPPKEVC